jgi:cell wall-associated NlpC family hydrolase
MTGAAASAAQEAAQRAAVVAEARTWLRTPYHHRARLKGVGVDCGMLLAEVFPAAGVVKEFIDPGDYPADWHFHRDTERYLEVLRRYAPFDVAVADLQPGDVPVWKFGRTFSHGAIYIGDGQIIHSYINRGCEIATLDDPELLNRPIVCLSPWGR